MTSIDQKEFRMRIIPSESFARRIRELDDLEFFFRVAHDAPYLSYQERESVLNEIDRRWDYDDSSTDCHRTLSHSRSLQLLRFVIG